MRRTVDVGVMEALKFLHDLLPWRAPAIDNFAQLHDAIDRQFGGGI